MDYYSGMKKNEITPLVDLDYHSSEVREKQVSLDITYM